MKNYPKIIPDTVFHGKGRHFNESWYNKIIDSDNDVCYTDD